MCSSTTRVMTRCPLLANIVNAPRAHEPLRAGVIEDPAGHGRLEAIRTHQHARTTTRRPARPPSERAVPISTYGKTWLSSRPLWITITRRTRRRRQSLSAEIGSSPTCVPPFVRDQHIYQRSARQQERKGRPVLRPSHDRIGQQPIRLHRKCRLPGRPHPLTVTSGGYRWFHTCVARICIP
jgi:hypothetical protein